MDENIEGQITSEKDASKEGQSEVKIWLEKIRHAKREEQEWRSSAQRAAKVYEAAKDSASEFNIYHANVETIVPALYSSTPVPDVRRRNEPRQVDPAEFGDDQEAYQAAAMQAQQESQTAADVAEITERSVVYAVDMFPWDDVIEDVVRDAAVVGRGVPRIRFKPPGDLYCELVPWNRFIRGPGSHWHHMPFVAFEHDLTRDQVEVIIDDPKRLEYLPFATEDGRYIDDEEQQPDKHAGILRTIKVYEIWCRLKKEVLFVSPSCRDDKVLARMPDPLQFPNFFPVPRPLQTQRRLSSLTPMCPFDIYEPQINEIAEVSRRIRNLIKQLRVRGLFDAKMAPDFEQLESATDGQYFPAQASEDFVQGGGGDLSRAVMHWPIEQIMNVISALYQEREAIKTTIYEVMGIADIMRGAVDPNEKLGQTQMKMQSGSQRLQRSQNEVARVARDLFRMMAHVVHKHFSEEEIAKASGMQPSPAAMQIMRGDTRSFLIDIETDSTVRGDMAHYQEELRTFLEGTAQIAQATANIAQTNPQVVPALWEVYAGFARKFNLGKQGEDALDKLSQAAQQPPAQEGDDQAAAEQQAAEQAQAQAQAEMEAKAADREADRAAKAELHQMQLQQAQAKHEAEMEAKAYDAHVKETLAQLDIEGKLLDYDLKKEMAGIEREAKDADIRAKEKLAHIQARKQQQTAKGKAA